MMIRQLLNICLLTVSVSAFTGSVTVPKTRVELNALNIPWDIKEDFSGPGFTNGKGNDPVSFPTPLDDPEIAYFLDSEEGGQMELASSNNVQTPVATQRTFSKRRQWSTAVFWSSFDLYGLTLAK